ncbi:MAG: hypothetical protein KME02_02045 [Aphanothece saxicola GSE-SYN-MK-01-06B]|jgi:hypothetical protein|nr:hypothetical protein [Aphanothece saxicola GSE-SYN-MK-01-06B]
MNSSNQLESNHLEALKLVRDWSSGLIIVESAAIGVIGSLLRQSPTGWYGLLTALLLVSLVGSIWVGAVWVVGTIPSIAEKLPTLLQVEPQLSIYEQKGGLKGEHPSLGTQCRLQIRLFLLSLVLFSLFVFFAPPETK